MKDGTLAEQGRKLADLLPRLMRRLFTLDPADPAMDLPAAQLRVCSILGDGECTISGLSKELNTSVSAATQIADRLESAELVERVPGTRDRRVKRLQLTPHGAALLRLRRGRRARRATEVLGELSPATRRGVLRALDALLAASGAAAPGISENDASAARG